MKNNRASLGGVLAIDNPVGGTSYQIVNTNFTDNSANIHGGVFNFNSYNYFNQLIINRCWFIRNIAGTDGWGDGDGGVIASYGATLMITNSYFNNNSAVNGGVLRNGAGPTYLASTSLIGNTATLSGGAIFQSAGDDSFVVLIGDTLSHTLVAYNSAINGGAIFVSDAPFNATNIDFQFNSATNGAVFYADKFLLTSPPIIVCQSCTFENNEALYGAGDQPASSISEMRITGDNHNPSLSLQTPGVIFNPTLSLIFYDVYGQQVTTESSVLTSVTASPLSSDHTAIGQTLLKAANGVVTFTSLGGVSYPGTSVYFLATTEVKLLNNVDLRNLAVLFEVTFRNCSAGEGVSLDNLCVPCIRGQSTSPFHDIARRK
jgi:predicted outer membrane repeat protein